jgi:thioredoxin-related protein
MKKIFLPMLVLAGIISIMAVSSNKNDAPEGGPVKWMTFEEAVQKSKTEKRKIFIDVYTDWCGWCKVMDKNTFNDPAVAKLLNEKFYPVKFNAEQREDIQFDGHTFKFIENGRSGYHQLAAALLNNQLSYPTVVFLDEEFKMLQPLPGYRQAPEFHKFATFWGEGHYKTQKWPEWEPTYKSPYPAKGN